MSRHALEANLLTDRREFNMIERLRCGQNKRPSLSGTGSPGYVIAQESIANGVELAQAIRLTKSCNNERHRGLADLKQLGSQLPFKVLAGLNSPVLPGSLKPGGMGKAARRKSRIGDLTNQPFADDRNLLPFLPVPVIRPPANCAATTAIAHFVGKGAIKIQRNSNRHESCFANAVQGLAGNSAFGVAAAIAVWCALGCSATQPLSSSSKDLQSADAKRLASAAARLFGAVDQLVNVKLIEGDRPAAYSWTDGTVQVTAGLVELVNDDQLTAALAHEFGHLRLAHRSRDFEPRFALRGDGADDDEMRADEVACQLLKERMIPPSALAEALARVRDAPQTSQCLKPGLTHRIEILSSR